MEFSISAMKRKIKGETNKRVSEPAAEELGEELDEYGQKIAEKAIKVAEEDGRKTVRGTDILEAKRRAN